MQAALGRLETALGRFMDSEARQTDIEVELGVMQDDRARLATELESATLRLAQVEAVSTHVGQRIGSAIAAVQQVLSAAQPGGETAARDLSGRT
jgi:hypothetical protein